MRSSRRSAAAGWCDVYRALDTRLNRPVAITVLDNGQRFLFNARY